jgi:nucleoside-diphosphate-sugar epimerase
MSKPDTGEGPVVALTGATGFIGRRIATQLGEAGFRLRVLARDPARLNPTAAQAGIVQGSLSDDAALSKLMAGATAVVHCAGSVRGVTREQFYRVNVYGTAACAAAARRAGTGRFLSISSLAAREPQLSAYAASKRAGEDAVLDAAGDIPVTIVRPPAVYGPGDREMLPLFRLMARGFAPVFGSPKARFSLIFVDDIARAIEAWLQSERPAEGLFEIDDGKIDGYDWKEVCDAVTSITGRLVHQVRIPRALLSFPAGINSFLGRHTDYAPMLSLGKVRELRHPDWVCREGRSFVAGWTPCIQLPQGLAATPGWRDQ